MSSRPEEIDNEAWWSDSIPKWKGFREEPGANRPEDRPGRISNEPWWIDSIPKWKGF